MAVFHCHVSFLGCNFMFPRNYLCFLVSQETFRSRYHLCSRGHRFQSCFLPYPPRNETYCDFFLRLREFLKEFCGCVFFCLVSCWCTKSMLVPNLGWSISLWAWDILEEKPSWSVCQYSSLLRIFGRLLGFIITIWTIVWVIDDH